MERHPRFASAVTALAVTAACVHAASLAGPAPLAAQVPALTAEVESSEIAFARTMADRDLEAFRSFLAPEAVFFRGDEPLRGRDAIVEAWAPFFEGPTPPFSWRPDVVQVLETGDLALTSGPVMDASGSEVGRFNTVWRRQADGRWLVVFDKGS